MTFSYPQTVRGDHTDVYTNARGERVTVADPYRWLEDPDSPETVAWVAAQNEVTGAFLSGLSARQVYRERLSALWDYPKEDTPWKRGGRYFRTFNPGLLNQPVLQVADQAQGPWQTLLDPNILSTDGTVALMGASVNWDGSQVAYALQSGGSDWLTWRVRDVGSGEDHPDVLEWSKFSGAAWLPSGSGFYYAAYDAPAQGAALTGTNRHQRLMFHRLGTPQADDTLVLARPDEPDWGFRAQITDDQRFLVIHVWQGTSPKTQVWVRKLHETGPFTELVGEFRASFEVLGNDGDTLYLLTDEDAPLRKVIGWSVATGARQDLIPEGRHALESVRVVPGGFLAVTLQDASHRLHLHSRTGEVQRELALPTFGTVLVNAQQQDPEVFLGFTSFLFPTTAYRLHLPGGELEALSAPAVAFETDAFEVTQEFATSPDGTRIPMFIVGRKHGPGTGRPGTGEYSAGEQPTLLYGYGGFNISLTPAFSLTRLAWLERGGVFVQANLRGGSEYGEDWHLAGTLAQKQNVFDDFIACAEHLISTGRTRPEKLAIQGRSNGGLLVGACMTQRPELFACATVQVGVLDMLRYHQFTIGWAWASDYGRSDDPQMFDALYAYSPLHNVQAGVAYPATLITTGDHDDRVVPAHSFKFAAELQRAHAGAAPTLIRIQTRGGHGAGLPTSLLIEEWADVWAFTERALGMS